MTSHSLLFLVLGFLAAGVALAQTPAPKAPAAPAIRTPAPSPTATLKQRVGLTTDVEVVYARPSARGRKIFGGLLPYGEVWRTGANTATKVTFSTPVKIDGKTVEAGSYALYSIPGQSEWTLMLSKVVGEWGAYAYKQENDVVRTKVKVTTTRESVETFTIDINDIKTESATLTLSWETTKVALPFSYDVIGPVAKQIEETMASGATLAPSAYYQAAMFYYDTGLDLAKAKEWIEKATANDKATFFMIHGKAKILAKLGDKAGATEAAKKSIELASTQGEAVAGEYKRLNEAVLTTLK